MTAWSLNKYYVPKIIFSHAIRILSVNVAILIAVIIIKITVVIIILCHIINIIHYVKTDTIVMIITIVIVVGMLSAPLSSSSKSSSATSSKFRSKFIFISNHLLIYLLGWWLLIAGRWKHTSWSSGVTHFKLVPQSSEPGRLPQSGASQLRIKGSLVRAPVRPHSFVEIWSWKHFYDHSHPSADSRRAVVSYWRKNGHYVLENCLGGLSRNSVAKLTDRARNDLKRVEGP